MLDTVGCEEVYTHEMLDDVVEMRPSLDDYVDIALRDNYTRSLAGLEDWQADFPAGAEDVTMRRMTLEELLSVFV